MRIDDLPLIYDLSAEQAARWATFQGTPEHLKTGLLTEYPYELDIGSAIALGGESSADVEALLDSGRTSPKVDACDSSLRREATEMAAEALAMLRWSERELVNVVSVAFLLSPSDARVIVRDVLREEARRRRSPDASR